MTVLKHVKDTRQERNYFYRIRYTYGNEVVVRKTFHGYDDDDFEEEMK